MTKLHINYLNEKKAVISKDEALKLMLRFHFDSQDNSPEGYEKMEEIILTAREWGFHQLAVEFQKELDTAPGYKVISTYNLVEDIGNRFCGMRQMVDSEIPIVQ